MFPGIISILIICGALFLDYSFHFRVLFRSVSCTISFRFCFCFVSCTREVHKNFRVLIVSFRVDTKSFVSFSF